MLSRRPAKPFVASMGIYLFSRAGAARHARAARQRLRAPTDTRRADALSRLRVPVRRLLGGRRHGRELLRRQHPVDSAGCAVQFLRRDLPDLHAPALPAAVAPAGVRRPQRARCRRQLSRGLPCVRLRRGDPRRSCAAAPRSGVPCCSARTSTKTARRPHGVPLGIGADVEIDRAIIDKNARIGAGARLVNTSSSTSSTATATTFETASSSCRRTERSRRDSCSKGLAPLVGLAAAPLVGLGAGASWGLGRSASPRRNSA